MFSFGPFTNNLINTIIEQFKKKKTKNKINKFIIEPIMFDIHNKYYSYIMLLYILIFVIVILLIALIVLTLKNNIILNQIKV